MILVRINIYEEKEKIGWFFSQFEPALKEKRKGLKSNTKHETIIKVYSQEPKLVFAACFKVFFSKIRN